MVRAASIDRTHAFTIKMSHAVRASPFLRSTGLSFSIGASAPAAAHDPLAVPGPLGVIALLRLQIVLLHLHRGRPREVAGPVLEVARYLERRQPLLAMPHDLLRRQV